MTLAAAVYAKQLFYRGHGLPMWIPEPSEFGAVQIGDVGYVVDGCFYRLFNATKPADHPLNCNGVPASFEPLVFQPSLVHRVNDYLPPGPLCSRSVRDAEVRIGVAAEGAAGGASYRFTCSEDRGALVVIGGDATKEQVHPNNIFPSYMRRQHESWHAFATNGKHFALDLKPEDIIFVRGWVKTTEWAVAAFLDKGTAHELSIQAGIGSYAHADVKVTKKEHISTSLEWRSGPKQSGNPGQVDGGDQCIFLSAYKLKRRALFPATIKAMSRPDHPRGPPSPDADILRSPTPSSACSDDSVYTISESPPVVMIQDPIEDVLDYILETSTADVAIASHTCVEDILRGTSSGLVDLSDSLSRHDVVVDELSTGMLCTETDVNLIRSYPLQNPYLSDYLSRRDVVVDESSTVMTCTETDVDLIRGFTLQNLEQSSYDQYSSSSRSASARSTASWDEDSSRPAPYSAPQTFPHIFTPSTDFPTSRFDRLPETIDMNSWSFYKPTEPDVPADDEEHSMYL